MIKTIDIFNPSSKFYYPLRIIIIFLLGLAIYYQTFGFGFVFDDKSSILDNPYIKNFKNFHLIWVYFPKTRLIGMYSFAFNYSINHLDPKGYHIFNFLIHLLVTYVVWSLARTIFKIVNWFDSNERFREEIAFIIALLFLVHPVQTQAITYIWQRFESIATLFYLGSVFCYIRARISSNYISKISYFISSGLFALLGIFTKETAVTIPAVILITEFILLNRNPLKIKVFSIWKNCIPLAILGAVFVVIFIKTVRTNFEIYYNFHAPSDSHDGDVITSGKYVLTQMRVFLTFLRLLILPINQNLDYDYPLSSGFFDPPLTLMGMGLISLMIFLILKLREKWPLIAFGMAWILITFSINTAPRVNVIFEHKLYLISFGFFILIVCILVNLIKDRRILFGVLITLVAVFSLVSFKRNQVWRNELTLWNDVIEKSPHKARPYINRGGFYYDHGNFTQALLDYNKAIELRPTNAEVYSDRGNIYQKNNDYNQALKDYNKAIELNSDFSAAYSNRAGIYYNQGNFDQALSDYNKAIKANIGNSDAYYNRGCLYYKKNDLLKALFDFTRTIELNPNFADAYAKRGLIYQAQGNLSESFINYNKAIELNTNIVEVYNNRGLIYYNNKYFVKAISDYERAIEINPNFAAVYNNRAVAYYGLKKYAEAWVDVQKSEELGITVNPNFIMALKESLKQ